MMDLVPKTRCDFPTSSFASEGNEKRNTICGRDEGRRRVREEKRKHRPKRMSVIDTPAPVFTFDDYQVPLAPEGEEYTMQSCTAELFSIIKHPRAIWNSEKVDSVVRHSLTLRDEAFRSFLEESRVTSASTFFFHLCVLSDLSIAEKDRVYFTRFLAFVAKLFRLHPEGNVRIIMESPLPLSVAVDRYDGEIPLLVSALRDTTSFEKILFFMEQCQNVEDLVATRAALEGEDKDDRFSPINTDVVEGTRLVVRFKKLLQEYPNTMTSLKGKCEETIANKRYLYALKFILQHEEHSAENRLLNDDIVYHISGVPRVEGWCDLRVAMLEELSAKGYPFNKSYSTGPLSSDRPITRAARTDADIFEAVIANGGDAMYTTLRSDLPLEKQFGRQLMGATLYSRNPHYYPKGTTLLGYCACFGTPETVEVLLRHYREEKIEINTPENILSVIRPGLRKENLVFLVQNGFNMKLKTFLGEAVRIAGFYCNQEDRKAHQDLFDLVLQQESEYNALMRQKA